MPAWRSPDLEALFGGPLDHTGITEAAIEQLKTDGASESDQLDFKEIGSAGVPYPKGGRPPPWTEEQEFAKDVSALANHRGGVLLLGVAETGGRATALTPITGTQPDAEERRLRQALLNHQAPFLEPAFVPVTASSGGWYLAVVIPPSPRSPHAVLDRQDGRNPLRYPVRHGTDIIWMTEHEVAERYRRRLSAQDDERARSQRVVAEGLSALRRSDGLWAYVAAVPEFAASGRLDNALAEEVSDWYHRGKLSSPLANTLLADGRGIPGPGRVTFTGSRQILRGDETRISGGYVELHVDGSAFAAKEVKPGMSHSERSRISDIELADHLILLVDVALRWCAHQAVSWGTATLNAGIFDASTDDGQSSSALTLVCEGQFGEDRHPGTRAIGGRPTTSVPADLAAVESVQQRLSAAYLGLCGLLQWFGRAEPRQLRRDGTIVPVQFGTHVRQEVAQWASFNGVSAE